MTDWTPEEDEAFNNVEKNSNLGKQILRDMGQPYVYEPKREWVGLTDEEIEMVYAVTVKTHKKTKMPPTQLMFARTIQEYLKSKNT